MKQAIAIIIVVLCIIATFGITYIFVNDIKDDEILNLKERYELDIYNLNNTIDELNDQLENIPNIYEEEKFLGSWLLPDVEIVTYHLNRTTTTSLHDQAYDYMVSNGQIYFIYEPSERVIISDYDFSENNTMLTLTNPETGEMTNYTKLQP